MCVQRAAASGVIHGVQILAAAHEVRKQGEGRGNRFGQQVDKGAGNDAAQAELGVVDIAADGHGDIDNPVAVGKQGNPQSQGQIHRLAAVHPFPQLQLLDDDLVVAL